MDFSYISYDVFRKWFCIQMITGHKGFSLSLVETITMQKVAPIAGLFLCAAVIFALEIPAAGLLKKGMEKQKSMLISAGVSVVSAVILFVWKEQHLQNCYRRKEFYDSWYFGVWHFFIMPVFILCIKEHRNEQRFSRFP